ncbi:inositol-trisphosphate 3-kinase homolog isoform X2 [Ctenocephalides felis]|nr:inositol-trisphosphate 3-kinase homolog isoform X2 [Ctenocephalides felis]
MSLLKFLAINALELSAPASPALLQTRTGANSSAASIVATQHPQVAMAVATRENLTSPQINNNTTANVNGNTVSNGTMQVNNVTSPNGEWIQLSGHPASIAPSAPGAVCKRLSRAEGDHEARAYRELAADPLASRLAPAYLGEFSSASNSEDRYIELEDLLHGFRDPHVMDIKIGRRTFLESEVGNSEARKDLFRKMVEVDPEAPTAEEKAAGAVTKMRYMTFREQLSSSQSKGFRIEALKVRGSAPLSDLKRVRSHSDVARTVSLFLGGGGRAKRSDVASKLLKRLREMRDLAERSEFFATHEVVGSSVFVAFDDTKVGAWLIDFAKARRLPEGVRVDHRSPWTPGNHEEGFLHGMDQLIEVIEEVHQSMTCPSIKNCSSRSATLVS